MKKFFDGLTDKLQGPVSKLAIKLSSIKFISALSETFMALVPILIVGAFGCLSYMMPFTWYQNIIAKIPAISTVGGYIHMLSLYILGIYMLVVLPGKYASKLGMKDVSTVAPITLLAYLMLCKVDFWYALPFTEIGQQGMISVMIVSFVVPQAMKFLVDHNVRINMPDSVPSFVQNGFAALVPAFIIVPAAGLIAYLLSLTTYGSFNNLIYGLIQKPLTNVGASLFGNLIYSAGASLLAFFGIHASAITSVFEPVLTAAALENMAAWTAGTEIPYICVGGFLSLTGGGGMLFASLALVLFSKNKTTKEVAKFAVVPSIFGISEPVMFGVPVMLNMYYFIPYMLCPIFNSVASYLLISAGILGKYNGVTASFITPFIMNQALTSTTPVAAIIWQIVQLGINLAIWYPFIKIADKAQEENQ